MKAKTINCRPSNLNNTFWNRKLGRTALSVSQKVLFKLPIAYTLGLISIISCNNVNALEYSSSAGVNFTINPSISVSVSGDLIIDELAPGSSSDSNVINVTVLSNNSTGYVLSSTVGTSSVASTDLKLDGNSNDNTNKFTNLNTNKANLSNFDDNYWGYSYSVDAGANWISGNTGSTASGYNGLPLYSGTGIKLVDTTAIGTNTIKFKIGAKASNTQAAGEYTNTVNFTVVGKAVPVTIYQAFENAAADPNNHIEMLNGYYKIQDMTPAICNAVEQDSDIYVIDTRDNEIYMIGRLADERCWMKDNLRLGSNDNSINLTPQDTNIAEAWTLPKGVTSGVATYVEAKINAAYKNDTTTSYGTGSGKIGVYYNFCAASAGTYCYNSESSTGNAQYNICPANWRMPTGGYNGNEYGILYNAYSGSADDFRVALSTPLSGNYPNNSQANLGANGLFWTSTRLDNSLVFAPVISFGPNDVYPYNGIARSVGLSARCIANN